MAARSSDGPSDPMAPAATLDDPVIAWPPKFNVFGVSVSALTRDEGCEAMIEAARQRVPAVVSAFAVHAIVEASSSEHWASQANRFAMILPDGQPLRWALNWLHGANVRRTVQGYELMQRVCQRAAEEGFSIYLYGSSPQTLAALEANLRSAYPDLRIAGTESPPFRPLTREEDVAMVERVNASGASFMFIGLGCPRQDHFAADHLDRIDAVQFCVGAAFDFLAGTKSLAPDWMQRHGLAWVYRLVSEPSRLWKRYLTTNSIFMGKLINQFIRQRVLRRPTHAVAPGAPHGA